MACFIGVILAFLNHLDLGLGIILFCAGLLSLNRFLFKQEPYFMAGIIKGGDYLMKKLLKEKFNQYYNLFLGLTLLIFGLILFLKYFKLF